MIGKYIGHRPDLARLILRIVVGLVFFIHGVQKFQTGIEGVAGFFGSVGVPAAMLMAWIVTVVETFGGLALILGLWTRIASILLSVVMIVAIITVKWDLGFTGGYEFDLTLLGGLLAIMFGGGGKYALGKMTPRSAPAPLQPMM